jgi:hypothetical protein
VFSTYHDGFELTAIPARNLIAFKISSAALRRA